MRLLAIFGLLLAMPLTAAAYTFDRDVPEAVKNQIINDLKFIGTIEGSGVTPLHKQVFGEVHGPTYVKFFEDRVSAVGMHECGGGKAVACVIPFYDPTKIWLTKNYVQFDHPQIAKMMVVYHEARHTESKNGNWSHANCPRPFRDERGEEIRSIWTGASLAGEAACDRTPFGSYGSSTIMLKNIQKHCASCTEKVKMDAGLYADDQFKRIINADAKRQMLRDLYDAATGLL